MSRTYASFRMLKNDTKYRTRAMIMTAMKPTFIDNTTVAMLPITDMLPFTAQAHGTIWGLTRSKTPIPYAKGTPRIKLMGARTSTVIKMRPAVGKPIRCATITGERKINNVKNAVSATGTIQNLPGRPANHFCEIRLPSPAKSAWKKASRIWSIKDGPEKAPVFA